MCSLWVAWRQMIEYFKSLLCLLTVEQSIALLRDLGEFHKDYIEIIWESRHWAIQTRCLTRLIGPCKGVCELARIHFKGGPTQETWFETSYLAYLVDRCLLTVYETSLDFVNCVIARAKS